MIKVADIIEEHKKGNIPAATMIKMAAFKAELEKRGVGNILTETMTNPDVVRGARQALGGILTGGAVYGLGALIHMGIQSMEHAWDEHQLSSQLEPMFERVIVEHPELSESPDKLNLAKKYFDALYHFSPSMAQSPLAAGAYIKQALQMHHVAGGPLPEMVEKATLVQKNMADIHDKEKSEYTTPLGALFVGLKPMPGKAYEFKLPSGKK